jgi:PelA/Pel-15E family pectate lyase
MNLSFLAILFVLFCADPVEDPKAERMLLYQRANGGWPQPKGDPINYDIPLTDSTISILKKEKYKEDTTIDDDATTREIRYLAEKGKQYGNKKYLKAAEKGIYYLLAAQNTAGGWGQFFPDTSSYRKHITFNDNAMVNVLQVLKSCADGNYQGIDTKLLKPCQKAVNRGVKCILACQYLQKGKLTVWCAQHDRKTLLPANARSFELASLSGAESVGIVQFLMRIENPDERVKQSIHAAMDWFNRVKIQDMDIQTVRDQNGKAVDRILVSAPGKVLWARFYDLKSNTPLFVGRNGIAKTKLEDIELERRLGYSFYGSYAQKLIEKDYPLWKEKWDS